MESNNQTTTRFRFILPETVRLNMDDGRDAIAAALDQVPGAEAIFHYGKQRQAIAGRTGSGTVPLQQKTQSVSSRWIANMPG